MHGPVPPCAKNTNKQKTEKEYTNLERNSRWQWRSQLSVKMVGASSVWQAGTHTLKGALRHQQAYEHAPAHTPCPRVLFEARMPHGSTKKDAHANVLHSAAIDVAAYCYCWFGDCRDTQLAQPMRHHRHRQSQQPHRCASTPHTPVRELKSISCQRPLIDPKRRTYNAAASTE
jgi:hypothetical protein